MNYIVIMQSVLSFKSWAARRYRGNDIRIALSLAWVKRRLIYTERVLSHSVMSLLPPPCHHASEMVLKVRCRSCVRPAGKLWWVWPEDATTDT
eukprot:scaffold218660_cov46-Prasinocladus_malaysianus.AAC.1